MLRILLLVFEQDMNNTLNLTTSKDHGNQEESMIQIEESIRKRKEHLSFQIHLQKETIAKNSAIINQALGSADGGLAIQGAQPNTAKASIHIGDILGEKQSLNSDIFNDPNFVFGF